VTISVRGIAIVAVAIAGCFPTTTRPDLVPLAGAPVTEVELQVPEATQAIALLLDQDSIPIRRTVTKDGWLESEWLDANTLRPTGQRHLGPDVVKVRIWVDPSRPNHSNVTAETVFLLMVNPSRPERELEREAPPGNKVAGRVLFAVSTLARQYGGVVDSVVPPTDTVVPIPLKGLRDTGAVRHDTTAARPDTTKPVQQKSRDTTMTRPDSTTPVRKKFRDTTTTRPDSTTPVQKKSRDTTGVVPSRTP
jgi:hypothetical protein